MNLDGLVRSRLRARTRFRDIRLLDRTASTNRLVAGWAAAGEPEGLVVVADFQTAGRGRLDRSWDARPGDALLVSVLLRPAALGVERRHLVTAAVALAAADACAAEAGIRPDIKWPNDLLAGGLKLAGILAEAVHSAPPGTGAATTPGAGEPAVVVGMGLNVHGGPPGAAVLDDLAGRRVPRAGLLAAWLEALEGRLGDWDAVAADYVARCATVGRDVSVLLATGAALEGRADRLDGHGRLVVRTSDGAEETVAVGDVTHLR